MIDFDCTICKDLKNVLNRGVTYKESFIQNFSSFEDKYDFYNFCCKLFFVNMYELSQIYFEEM